ncbi:hypothetical protein KIN20_006857 [Parelaphostrongylus tenuis]|uniref:dolichol kinase n=1 Tax=Parelaphostrongylus tenuis TaxID=148309 RepID=A0AAD5M5I8_PARTN|nr:hypothetical protein KIN20_006857 [Parelaphostrongylus tenuis]
MIDYGPLVELAIVTTLMVVVCSPLTSRCHPAFVNIVVLLSVSIAMIIYSILMNLSMFELFDFLWRIVFNSERSRYFLLIFWVCNVLASIGFGIFVNAIGRSSTIHRKFFHLTVSMIYLSGIRYDHDFVWLCGWMMLCMFVIVEVLRFFKVPPWEQALNNFLLSMKDEQDSALLLTPIFLLLGVFLPLFLSPNEQSPHLYHLAGVAATGVGDSVAAIVGSQWGRTKWPRGKKSVEGSTAMAVATTIFLLLARPFCVPPLPSCAHIVFVSLILSAVEAVTVNVDNIILPTVGYLLL